VKVHVFGKGEGGGEGDVGCPMLMGFKERWGGGGFGFRGTGGWGVRSARPSLFTGKGTQGGGLTRGPV